MTTAIIRNGEKLCAKCRDKGCGRYIGGQPDDETEYVSDEPCECCELTIGEINDGFGI